MKVTYLGWLEFGEHDESFFSFCERYYGGVVWKLRKYLGLSWFYNSKAYRFFVRLSGVVLVLLSIALLIALIYIDSTDYSAWLDVRF